MVNHSCTVPHLQHVVSCRTSLGGHSVVVLKVQLGLIWLPYDDRLLQLVASPVWFLHEWVREFHYISAKVTASYTSVMFMRLTLWPCHVMSQQCLLHWQSHLSKPYAAGKWELTVFQCYCNQLVAGIFLETMDIKANVWLPSQGLNIDYLNIAQISRCNWVQTALTHNYGQSGWSFFLQHRKRNSCLPVQHTAHRQIMQVGQFGSCIVIAWSGNDQAAFQSTHTFI